ncbi:MAG TPA: GNAT family N-acetyltransferase [Pseudonocardiaceae bacterium]|jgi:ribosomal protein S18 acetylase RimI-like enzyme|nr:GNAT family N-acetyltransferase [Pseudonocardiaceae bacterium]
MAIELSTPDVGRLGDVIRALRDWQDEASPTQLHPGDLGWYWRYGPEAMAAALRTWSRDGQLLAIGFLDGPEVLRMTVAPQVWRADELAHQVVADVSGPRRGVLPAGKASVETPDGTRVRELLSEAGWSAGEPWTPLRRDLTEPVEQTGLRIEVVRSGQESECTAVHRSAWSSPRFTDELWRAMATGLPYTDARCLLAYDDQGVAVAGATVWSAGPGKPGLLEPVGVHAEHRGHGYGRKISIAAAAELRKLGSSSAEVCTRSANTAAVATYRSAGFRRLPERLDRSRDA